MSEPTGVSPVEAVARAFHTVYEQLAPEHGWTTQDTTRGKPWEDVPAHNRALMLATVAHLLEAGVITVGPSIGPFQGG